MSYDPGGGADVLNLAQQTGSLQGTAQRMNQQRAIDAQTSHMAIAAAEERNNRPGFYERVSQGSAAEGERATARFDAQQAQDQARSDAEDAQRAAAAQQAQQQSQAAGQREQEARLLESFNADGQTPQAAQKYEAEAIRNGIKPNSRIAATAGPETPSEQAATSRANTQATQAGTKLNLEQQQQAERERSNRAREDIQRQRIRTQAAGGLGSSAAAAQHANVNELAGWGYTPGETVGMLDTTLDGKPNPAGAAAVAGIFSPNKTPGEIAARIDQLEQAGARPQMVQVLRAKQQAREQQYIDVNAQLSAVPINSPADLQRVLDGTGLTFQQLQRWVDEVARQKGY